ncbi:MAG: PQQ-like beta-propeller repeat protein [Verrucomicrobia bacterium]|nr:PQQ-like beta-propeller repeat protein [Verrucomicrobiota bacterium]
MKLNPDMKSCARIWACVSLILVTTVTRLAAEHWNRFRGPNGTGLANSSVKLSELKKSDVVWKLDLPGKGHSSPVIWDDTLYLTSMNEESSSFHVIAIHSDSGSIHWSRDLAYQAFSKHDFNSFASPSAAVDADRIYLSWATRDHYFVAAMDHAGEWLWKEDLGPFKSQHGVGVSPIIYHDKLIVANDQLGKSFIIALDKRSGSTIWKTERQSDKTAYSTPCIYKAPNGKDQLIANSAADGISGLDLDTGKVLWSYANAFDKRSCSSPIVAGGKVFGSCGSGGGGNFVVAVEPPSDGSNEQPKLAYEIRRSANYVPTPIAVGDLAFFWSDGGILTCANPVNGEIHYQERVRGRYFGSPVSVGGELACVSTTGEIVVTAVSKEFEILNRLDLDATTHTTPAFDQDSMYVRTVSQLYKFKN